MIFTTADSDAMGLLAIEQLGQLGYNTKTLPVGACADDKDIALFTPNPGHFLQGSRGKFVRTSSVKLSEVYTPSWALSTPFRVAVLRTEKKKRLGRREFPGTSGFPVALANMADNYKQWLTPGSDAVLPWTTSVQSLATGSVSETRIKEWLSCPQVQSFRQACMIKSSPTEDIRTIAVGQWPVNYCQKRMVFPAWAAERGSAMLQVWQDHFRQEQTWVRKQLSVPSLFVRLDCIVRDRELVLYEVEERPAGIGISSLVNAEFASSFKHMAESWPQFRVEISPLRRATDDYLWVKDIGWDSDSKGLVLVRAEPEEEQFHGLEPVSVSSLKAKGDKSYGVDMGLWKRVVHPDELPWNQAFVIKPLCGSKVRDLEFWDPKHRPGSSRRDRVEAELKRQGRMFMQLLHPPMETGMRQFPWMIFRIFYGYNPASKTWICLGGNWNARHNLRIHGASDAIFGPGVVE